MDRTDRDGRDAAGVGPYARERETLTPLSSLGAWKVSDGEPDIRGWEVRTVSGRQLGAVADLLIDADAGEVVLLDVDLPGADRHTFVPIRVVQIDRAKRVVLMDSADLPVANVANSDRGGPTGRRASDAGVVRYPNADRVIDRGTDRGTDREIIAERATLADAAPLAEPRVAADDEALPERRRQADRRRIDRVSTDL